MALAVKMLAELGWVPHIQSQRRTCQPVANCIWQGTSIISSHQSQALQGLHATPWDCHGTMDRLCHAPMDPLASSWRYGWTLFYVGLEGPA